MEGLRSETPALNVLVERKSRTIRLTKILNRTATATKWAIIDKLKSLPRRARKSVTYDNGHENSEHYKVNRKLKIRSYFCDAYCSWQKGSVEQSIGLVRRFIPKGWDISTVSSKYIARIEDLLNHRPRKCLDFATPAEVFEKLGGALPR
jgi:IS30 family transposase